jgi:UDP-N-acetylglucosamine 2-epimerase (non-hydrolysing)
MSKKILVVFGTRPEAIKMLPLIKEFQKYPQEISYSVCVTAQHRQMLDQVLNLFDVTPDFDLNIMRPNQDLFDVTSSILLGMRDVFNKTQPDIVLVHGDTTTTLAVSLAAFYSKVAVGHVEAGLRTWNLKSPWPEEANRQLTDVLADYYFAPTELSAKNLRKEGYSDHKIMVTGNTVIDALLDVLNKIKSSTGVKQKISEQIQSFGYSIQANQKIVLITGHRRENFGDGFVRLADAIHILALKYPNIDFVYPVHLNPHVRAPIMGRLSDVENIYLIEPLDYLPFVYLMSISHIILTDSGGIQEEAPSLHKPVLVTRDTTERPEAVDAGTVTLVGTDVDVIVREVSLLLDDEQVYATRSHMRNPYGDGRASEKIAKFLIDSKVVPK